MSKLVMHHYTACGLPDVWIQCRQVIDDAGQKTYIIPNIKELHDAIARWVVLKDGALSGAELRFLRSEMYLTAEEFGAILDRGEATIKHWEKSKGVPDAVTEAFIRILAADKLKLDKVDAAEIREKCSLPKSKKRVRIETTRHGHYRLAA